MTRREFLAFAAAAPLTAAPEVIVGGHPWAYAAPRPNYDITGVLDQIFADMSYAGLAAVELMHTAFEPAWAVDRIGELSRKHKLPVLGTSYQADMWKREQAGAILRGAETLIARLAAVGGRTLGTSVGDARRRKTDAELDAQADVLRGLIKLAQAKGVTVNLHNHTYEVTAGQHDLKGTLARVPEAKLGPDLNWLVRGGVDPVEFVRTHGERIVFAHLRDQAADGKWTEALGEGNTDFSAIGRALRDSGFSGALVIELAHERGFTLTRPLRESWKISREHVRRTMGY